jgi:hypothetical protein
MTRKQMIAEAKRLRAEGKTYREIGMTLGTPTGRAWALVNAERHRQNARESDK